MTVGFASSLRDLELWSADFEDEADLEATDDPALFEVTLTTVRSVSWPAPTAVASVSAVLPDGLAIDWKLTLDALFPTLTGILDLSDAFYENGSC